MKQAIVLGALALAAGTFVALRFGALVFNETMYDWAVAAALAAAVLFCRSPLPFAAMVGLVLFIEHPTYEAVGTRDLAQLLRRPQDL